MKELPEQDFRLQHQDSLHYIFILQRLVKYKASLWSITLFIHLTDIESAILLQTSFYGQVTAGVR